MFQQLLENVAQGLGARGLPYMVIGGQAVLLYGDPRLTRGIDITLGILASVICFCTAGDHRRDGSLSSLPHKTFI